MIKFLCLKRLCSQANQLALVFSLLFAGFQAMDLRAANQDPYEPSKIKAFTGASTRVVWMQDTTNVPTVDAERPTLRLMGWDSDDGKGERPILSEPAAYLKPLFTADGTRVVFGDNLKKTVSVVNWDGSGLRVVLEDAAFADIWTDPATGVEWVYAQTDEMRGDKEVPVIRRYRLDDPKVNELVWDKMPIFMFTVSGDGRSASGGGDGGNSPQGFLTLPNGNFIQRGGGCWPSIAPDDSGRTWVFSGNHRSIHFNVPTNREGTTTYNYPIRLDEAPGLSLTGREEVHRLRWSNNTRFMVCSAPFSKWDYRGPVKVPAEVAENIEIYIGRFSEDMKTLEQWMRVTSNNKGDYWADVWIKPGEGAQAVAMDFSREEQADASQTLNQANLVYTWETGAVGNQIDDPETGTIRQCSGLLKGYARFGHYHAMDLTGGWFVPDDTVQPLLKSVQKNQALTLEAIVNPSGEPADDRAVMLFGEDLRTAQFALYQRAGWLYLGLGQDEWPLAPLTQGQPNHVIVSLGDGHLLCTINGRKAMVRGVPTVDWSTWQDAPLTFGATVSGQQNWSGTLEGIRLFGRSMDFKEARLRNRVQQAKRADRQPIEPVVVEATLLDRSRAADPKGIAPYRRCLNVNLYEIKKVLQGKLSAQKIALAQWSVLDAKVIPEYEAMKEGSTLTLTIEAWDQRPEQDSERKIEGDFLDDVDLFYDATARVDEVVQPSAGVTRTWTSSGGGNWSRAENWSDHHVPTAADSVVLPAVSSGNRQVVIDQPATIHALSLAGGSGGNRLQLNDALSIRGSEKPLELAQVRTTVFDANGQDLLLQADSLSEVRFDGAVRLGGAGSVMGATVLSGGIDYRHSPEVKLSGPGHGAVAEAGMELTVIALTHLGSGYTAAPVVEVAEPDVVGGHQATAIAVIDQKSGALSGIRVTDPGSGYLLSPQITIEGGGGEGARAEAYLAVSEIYILQGGSGYTEPPVLSLEGGGGSGAQAIAATQNTILRGTADTAQLVLRNAGLLEQSGGRIVLDWAGSQDQSKAREFHNEGEWTMRNGTLKFLSSTGRPTWYGSGNTNSGTLRVLDHSWLGFSDMTNTGELELGTGVTLGQQEFANRDGTLRNEGEGLVRVTGGTVEAPAAFGVNSLSSNRPKVVHNGSKKEPSAARWIIGDGQQPAAFRIAGSEVELFNYQEAQLEIAAKGALLLETNDAGARHRFERRKAKLNNYGATRLAGALYVRSNHSSFGGIDNYGHLQIEGTEAQLVRLRNSVGPGGLYKAPDYTSLIVNRPEAVLKGGGTFTYVDQTGEEKAHYMRILNRGNLEPQVVWTLDNVNVYFGTQIPADDGIVKKDKVTESGGRLTIRIATAGNMSDTLVLKGQDDSGHFVLPKGTGTVLNIVFRGHSRPARSFRILTAVAVEGEFDVLQFNGSNNVPYRVIYHPDGIEVDFR